MHHSMTTTTGNPRNFNSHSSFAEIESALHSAEFMSILSRDIIGAFNSGELYESIEKMIRGLHANLVELSQNIHHVLPKGRKNEEKTTSC